MYLIYAGTQAVYAPAQGGYLVLDPVLEQEINKADTLKFEVPPDNPAYGSLGKLSTPVSVYRDAEEIFYGRVLESTRDFWNHMQITCEGALAFLNDSIVRPFAFTDKTSSCIRKFLQMLLDNHNSQVGSSDWKAIRLGTVTVTDANSYLYRHKESFATTWEILNTQLLESYGGYLKIRRSGGVTYLDYLETAGETINQPIAFGRNLLDLSEYVTAKDVYTVLVPLGAVQEDVSGEGVNNRLTIASVNDGKDYLESAAGIAAFGRIWATKEWDDVTTATALKSKGQTALRDGIEMAVTLDLDAVDLADAGYDYDRIRCGCYVPAYSVPHDLSMTLLCSKVSLALYAPEKTTYTLGAALASLTGSQFNAQQIAAGTVAAAAAVAAEAASTASSAASAAGEATTAAQQAVEATGPIEALQGSVSALQKTVDKLTGKERTFHQSLPNAALASGTITSLGSVTLPAGQYLVIFKLRFATNSSGYRHLGVSTSATSFTAYNDSWVAVAPAPSDNTVPEIVVPFECSAATTIYFLARQNSGGELNVTNAKYSIVEL